MTDPDDPDETGRSDEPDTTGGDIAAPDATELPLEEGDFNSQPG